MSTTTAHDMLAKFLKLNGNRRATPERHAVLNEIIEIQGHFDAEGLYYRLISKGSKVSRATVYNTLDLLQDCGLISKYRFTDGGARYERAAGKPHHHHMICLECGDIIEFVSERLERLQLEVCAEHSFFPQSSTFQVFGTCAKCSKRTKSKDH